MRCGCGAVSFIFSIYLKLILLLYPPESESGVSSVDMKIHSRNPRILMTILHPDATNQIIAPGYHGKSHMVISLLQDYRHGAPTANSLLVPIGFSVYKVLNYFTTK